LLRRGATRLKLAVTVPPEISALSHAALRQPVVRLLREVAVCRSLVRM